MAEHERGGHLARAERKTILEFGVGDSGLRDLDLRIMVWFLFCLCDFFALKQL